MSSMEELVEALTWALHETETSGGWWGHPECEEFARLVAPRLAAAGFTRGGAALFQTGSFSLHSGAASSWKVECDSLTAEDWQTLAAMIAERVAFDRVEGVPRGGLPLARALEPYCQRRGNRLLIVDDVLTTGGSMEEYRAGREAVGFVVFSRRELSTPALPWVRALWALDGMA